MTEQDWLTQFRQGNRRALSRLLTWASRGEHLELIEQATQLSDQSANRPTKHARVIAVTGSGGVGKSSFIGRMIEHLRAQDKSVAVLACDPQSSLTGGALLGDRIRMKQDAEDDGVFIRSLAAASGQQALAPHLNQMADLLSAFGFDIVLVETVGAGQGDTAVRDAADLVLVLLQPEAGDDLQWEKAGQLEIADVVVIHKSDLPGAAKVQAQVHEQLNLPGCREIPVLLASASKNQGIAEIIQLVCR